MYYVKIPLRHLCEPHELKVSEDERDAVWAKRVSGLLEDLQAGVLPQWAVPTEDLARLVLLREADGAQPDPPETK